jgi:hypothetical protein
VSDRHKAVDFAEAVGAMPIVDEPQLEIGTHQLTQASKMLKNDIRVLSRSAKKAKKEVDRLLEQLSAVRDAEADLTKEMENYAAEMNCR